MKHLTLLFVFFLLSMNALAQPPKIRGFNPDYQYHGIYGNRNATINIDRNETRREYNKRCAYNPAVCVRGYRSYE